MQFIDEVTVEVQGGDGGNGCVAMRREKFIPLGGPAGGDGGDGGNVIFVAHSGLSTLMDLHYRRVFRAERGEHGRGKDQYGRTGESINVRVPVGTQIFDATTQEQIGDLSEHGAELIVARGGRGGWGNKHFVTPYDRAPRRADPGEPGERRKLRLELKLLADVGIVGFPNAGKSTFIASVSKARPKIADYPFTTLVPNLGVVSLGDERSFVIADIPGIIEGAAEGAGLGIRFLKHVERTRVLLVLVTYDPDPNRNVVKDYDTLLGELTRFAPELASRPKVVAISKLDLPEVSEHVDAYRRQFAERGVDVMTMSAANGEGINDVLLALEALLSAHPLPSVPRKSPLPYSM